MHFFYCYFLLFLYIFRTCMYVKPRIFLQASFDKQSIIGLVIWACSVMYSSIRTASSSSKITMSNRILAKEGSGGDYRFDITRSLANVMSYGQLSRSDRNSCVSRKLQFSLGSYSIIVKFVTTNSVWFSFVSQR